MLQSLIAAAGAISVVLVAKGTYRIFLSTGASRGARIVSGVIGGLFVGASLYLTFTDLVGAVVGILIVAAYLGYRRSTRPTADFVVRDDVLLDAAVSPELGADLEDFASQLEQGARVSEGHFEVPDLPPMPGDHVRPRL